MAKKEYGPNIPLYMKGNQKHPSVFIQDNEYGEEILNLLQRADKGSQITVFLLEEPTEKGFAGSITIKTKAEVEAQGYTPNKGKSQQKKAARPTAEDQDTI